MKAKKYEFYVRAGDSLEGFHAATRVGQTFTVGNTGENVGFKVSSVKLQLMTTGTPGTITVKITGVDVNNKPVVSTVMATGTMDGTLLTGKPTWYEITMSSTSQLQPDTQYAIVVDNKESLASGDLAFMQTYTAASYAGGKYGYSADEGVTWTLVSAADSLFEVWGVVTTRMEPMHKGEYAKTKIAQMTKKTKNLISAGVIE